MFPTRIETERLVLERLSRDRIDRQALHEVYAAGARNEPVFEYWDHPPHATLYDTETFLAEAERLWDERSAAKYAIRPKDGEDGAGEIAGTARLCPDWETRSARLGILLARPFWGRGYAGERADALLSVAFERLGLELVVAVHAAGNERSRRAILKYVERHGGTHEGRLRNWLALPGGVMDAHRYSISRAEYLRER